MEIKIRSWDTDENKMSMFLLVDYMHSNEMYQEDLCPISSTNHMMLFTGMKDICGNDIYEGDILTAKIGEDGIVFYDDGCFKITSREYGIKNYNEWDTLCSDLIKTCNLAIVGNIHQNPELLED